MKTTVCAYCRHEVPDSSYCAVCGAPLISTQRNLEGKQIQSYVIDKLVGEGASGRLYSARHIATNQAVALKLLQPELATNPKSIRRFRREAEVGIRLQHAHAVKLFEFGISQDSGIFIVMELIMGKSLQDLLREEHLFPPERALQIALQLCEVLEKAHLLQIIHRDLKPANVLMQWHPDSQDFVKVCDFGLAKMELPSTDETRLTVPGTIYGTPGYMAPEQCLGEEADARTDIYAMGIVLYEMLSGRLPFVGSTPLELIMRPLQNDPMPLTSAHPQLAHLPYIEQLDAAVMRCLKRSPDDRYESAKALRLDLQLLLPQQRPETIASPITAELHTPPPPTAFPWTPIRVSQEHLDYCRELMQSAPTQTFLPSQTLFQKDQLSSRFYLIKSGEVRIIAMDDDRIVELDRLGAGDFVGVGPFFSRSPYTLTAESSTTAEIHIIDRPIFSKWVQEDSRLQSLFHHFYHEYLLQEVMRYSPFFAPIPPQHRSDLIASCEVQPVGRGQDILQQGQQGQALYVIASGQIEVYWPDGQAAPSSFTSRYLAGGQFFGELALLTNRPISASVRAVSNAILLRLPRQDLLPLLNRYPPIRNLLSQVAQARIKENAIATLDEYGDTIPI